MKKLLNGIADGIYAAHAETPHALIEHIAGEELPNKLQDLGDTLKHSVQTVVQMPVALAGDAATIFLPNKSALRHLKGLMAECHNARVYSRKFNGTRSGVIAKTKVNLKDLAVLKSLSQEISGRQLEALNLAVQHGFYNSPRKASVAQLAQKMGVDEATYSEHLRKVENKVLPRIAELSETLKAIKN